MTQSRLLAGSVLMSAEPSAGESSLGIVSGETSAEGTGQVQITLGTEHCSVMFAHSISVRIAEDHAKTISASLMETCIKLAHLRALHKRHRLDPSVLVAPAQRSQQSATAAIQRHASPLVELPAQRESPILTWCNDSLSISYVDVDERTIRIELDEAICARRLRVESTGLPRVLRVEGDSWFSGNVDAAPQDSEYEHFVVVFAECTFEAIANQCRVSGVSP